MIKEMITKEERDSYKIYYLKLFFIIFITLYFYIIKVKK